MERTSVWSLAILPIWLFTLVKPEASVNFEQQLRQELFTNRKLNPISRPGRYHNDTMNIKVECALLSLRKLDLRTNIAKMTIRLDLHWDNRDLAWNPRDYGGIETIQVLPSLIWIPFITLLNSAKKTNENTLHPTRAIVRNTGDVELLTPLTVESHCAMDIRHFPFDLHSCTLVFGSWTHDGTHVNVTSVLAKIYTEDFPPKSNEFQLIGMDGRRSTYRHTCCREIYTVGLFDLKFQRWAALYQVGILLPAALICLLTAGIFWIPPLSGQRLKMGLILLITNLLLLITLGLSLPISSTATPSIIVFCVHTLCFTALSLILSMVAVNLSSKHPSVPAPPCIQSITNGWLTKYLFVNTDPDEEETGKRSGWLTLVAVMDRVSFIIFGVSFLLLFILYLH